MTMTLTTQRFASLFVCLFARLFALLLSLLVWFLYTPLAQAVCP
jgi:hypothetical protein